MAKAAPDLVTVVAASDIHVPFHDAFAVRAWLSVLGDIRPSHVVLNGDIADFASVSLHEDGAPTPEFIKECESVVDFLADVRRRAPKAQIHYCEGNHENRLARYLAKKAPQLRGVETWQSALRLADHRISSSSYGHVHKIGKLGFTHGVFAGDLYTKQHLLRYGMSLVVGHCHRAQLYTTPVADEGGAQHVRGCFGLPCLAPVEDVAYIKGPTGWTQGFGVFYVEKRTGFFTPYVVIMNRQRFVYAGKVYDGRR